MKKIMTSKAPAAVGPYSQAIVTGSLLFISGQIALLPATGDFLNGDITQQTQQVLKTSMPFSQKRALLGIVWLKRTFC